MTPALRILIVDRSAESREVLRTLLERRGAMAVEADGAGDALALAGVQAPDLIVFDADSDATDEPSAQALRDLGAAAGRINAPIVVLGKLRSGNAWSAAMSVPKPYHYAPLVRKIETLLAGRR